MQTVVEACVHFGAALLSVNLVSDVPMISWP